MFLSIEYKNLTFVESLIKRKTLLNSIFLIFLANILLWLSAKIEIPFYPVPFTMQTLAVFFIGLTYGTRLGFITILTYLFAGAIGLPVFSGTPEKGIGIAYMLGPTGGYLFGFLVATIVLGDLARRGWDREFISTFATMVIANLIVYSFGLLWLGYVIGWDKPIFEFGMFPFLFGDLLKILMVTFMLPTLWKFLKKS